jgi:outer membrane protein/adhesin transport system outer membrane protein
MWLAASTPGRGWSIQACRAIRLTKEKAAMRTLPWMYSSVALFLLVGATPQAAAQALDQALATAYEHSTQLDSQRAQQRATDELVPQALSNWRPTISVNGNVTRSVTDYAPPGYNKTLSSAGWGTSKAVGVQVAQNIYRGGRTVAQTNQATNTVKAGQAQLKAVEQTVLLAAAQSYLDVVRDQVTVDLNANNEAVLKRQLDAENDRFRVGEVTRTDVALSQAAYEQARAEYTTAVGTLANDRAAFQRVVGQAPAKLVQPDFKYRLPASLEDAISEAESNNPSVVAAEFTERAGRDTVDLNEGNRLPTVQVIGSYSRLYPAPNSTTTGASAIGNLSAFGSVNHVDTGTVEAQMTWPLYTGGLVSSEVRQAKQQANQYLIAIEDAKRVARQSAISAWELLAAARGNVEALTAQVNAAQIGAEGSRQQALVGTATVLDSLTAEQNLLQAQVNLVGAQHDVLLNSFNLLAAVGRMTAKELSLAVAIYDPQTNQDEVGDKLFGTGID